MIKIAHRGNYKGRDPTRENTVAYVNEAIAAGFDVEVDAWLLDDNWYLGHNFPMTFVDRAFLERPQIWTHAKNLVGYVSLYSNPKVHVFWHNKDEFVFTSKGIKWANSGVVTYDGVMVMPENSAGCVEMIKNKEVEPLGICSDDFRLFE